MTDNKKTDNNLNAEEKFEEAKNNANQENKILNIDEAEKQNDNPENKDAKDSEKSLIKKLEEENQKSKEDLLRVLAELENTRRRFSEENEKTAKYAISKFAEELIPVMENFYLAFDNMKEEDSNDPKKIKSFFDGIKLTHNELKKVFDKNGLVRMFPIGEEFDPNFHNAITQIETSDIKEGNIAQVMQAGYKIKDRLLRPAFVAVAKPKS